MLTNKDYFLQTMKKSYTAAVNQNCCKNENGFFNVKGGNANVSSKRYYSI